MLFLTLFMVGAAAVAYWFFDRMPWLRPMRVKTLGLAMVTSFLFIEGTGFTRDYLSSGLYVMLSWFAITYSLLVAIWWINLLVAVTKNGGMMP